MLYLYILHSGGDPPLPPPRRHSLSSRDANFGRISWPGDAVAEAVADMVSTYAKTFGTSVSILGQQPVDGLPTSPDTFVVSTCLMALRKASISFDKDLDEISYSIDWIGQQRIGTCRILIRSPQPAGGRPGLPSGEVTVTLLEIGTSDKQTLVKKIYHLRDRYDLPKWNNVDFSAAFKTPSTLFEGVDPGWAELVRSQLQAAGAVVEINNPTSESAQVMTGSTFATQPSVPAPGRERPTHDPVAVHLAIIVLVIVGVLIALVILAQIFG